MTIGIYKLNFTGTDKVYIGQSEISIENRFIEHYRKFKDGTHSTKMNKAFIEFGLPYLECLIECPKEELDDLEALAIDLYKANTLGFNTCSTSGGKGQLYGDAHSQALYSNEEVHTTLVNIINNSHLSYKDIAVLSKVSLILVRDIASKVKHKWLAKEYPTEYTKLLRLPSRPPGVPLQYTGYLVSPTGAIVEVTNIRKFCTENLLDNAAIGRVLHGVAKTHKGWKLCPVEQVS